MDLSKQRFLNLGIRLTCIIFYFIYVFYLCRSEYKIFLKFKSQIVLSDTSYRQRNLMKRNLQLEENMNKIIRNLNRYISSKYKLELKFVLALNLESVHL